MRSAAVLTLAAVAVHAQVQNYTSSLNMTIDPGTVDDSRKLSWCNSQSTTCVHLCDNDVDVETCEYTDLSYECTCSNGSAPGLQYYKETMPTYICEELAGQCRAENAGDLDAQDECTSKIEDLCGELDPADADVGGDDDEDDGDDSSETTTSAPSPTETGSDDDGDDSDEQDDSTTTDADGFAAPTAAPMGVAAVAALGIAAAMV